MYCGNCGKQLSNEAKFCPECGSPVESDIYEDVGDADYADNYDYIDDEPTNVSKSNKLPLLLGMIKDKYKSSKKLRIATLCVVAMLVVGSVGAVIINNFVSSDGDGDSFVEELFNTKKRDDGIQFSTQCELYDCSNEYIIAESDNGKYGVLDFDGKEIIPFEYDKIEFADKDQKGDLFMVVKDDKCGVINYKNKSLIDRKYDAVGYFSECDRVYTLSKDKRELLFFDSKGKNVGKADFSCDSVSVKLFGSYVCSDNLEISEYDCTISIYGMLSSDVVCLSDNSGIKFVKISNGDVALNESNGRSIYRLVESDDIKYSYYRLNVITEEYVPDKLLPIIHTETVIIDANGNQVDEIVIRNSKGEKITSVSIDNYDYIKVLDDSGICLVREGSLNWYIVNLKNNEITDSYDYCYTDEKNNMVIMKNAKYQTTGLDSDIYAVYNFKGKKVCEYTNMFGKEVIYEQAVGSYLFESIGNEGFYFGIKNESSPYTQIFKSYNSDEIEIGKGLFDILYRYNSYQKEKGLSYPMKEVVPEYSYYSISSNDGNGWKYNVLNDSGDIMVDFGEINPDEVTVLFNSYGICFKSGDDVYWYNRK